MLAPKRVKYHKMMKGRTRGHATRGNTVAFGQFGLMATEPGWISNRQIEASRVSLTRAMKRGGKVWIRIFAPIYFHVPLCDNWWLNNDSFDAFF